MALSNIYLLPPTILIDVEQIIKTMLKNNQQIPTKDIYNMIKQRFKGKIKFTKKELAEYIEIKKKEINAPTLDELPTVYLPTHVPDTVSQMQDKTQDKSLSINVRNRAAVLDFFKNKIIERIKMIETQQGEVIDPYLEALIINYTKEMHTIIEKEIKLQLELEESSRLDKIVEERLGLLFILIKGVISKYVDEKTADKIYKDFEEIFKIYNMEEMLHDKSK